MNFRYLDMNLYKRKSHFDYFSSLAYPYVGLTANVDITRLLAAVKQKQLPLFLTLNYCVARAANSVPELRQRIIDGRIAEYDSCRTSHTVSLEDGTYCYCTLSAAMPFSSYLPCAVETQEAAKLLRSTDDKSGDHHELLFISSLPWLSYTALINPVPAPADSNPRITWGKYFTEGAATLLPLTLLCNHALVDGLHIAQFYESLSREIGALADELEA